MSYQDEGWRNWVACQQTVYGRIKFIESMLPEEVNSLKYHDFIEYLSNATSIVDMLIFERELNTFRRLLINKDTGVWEVYTDEDDDMREASFEELVALNNKEEESDNGQWFSNQKSFFKEVSKGNFVKIDKGGVQIGKQSKIRG